MNVLLVDDQINVINGLLARIHFSNLGYSQVYTATSVEEALAILDKHPVHVLVSDIEMPGRNGMELNAIARDRYPDMLRILLTSHAVFAYAQEGLKLGCFDYLVQPVPYAKIEESLSRAFDRLKMNEKHRQISNLGVLFDTHRTKFLNATMMDLFSKNPERQEQGLALMQKAGYSICKDSYIKLLLVDILNFDPQRASSTSVSETILTMKATIKALDLPEGVECIIGKNQFDQFAVLFFHSEKFMFNTSQLETMYARLESALNSRLACYVGWTALFSDMREVTVRVHTTLKNNVSREPGLTYVHFQSGPERMPTSLDEFVNRWNTLLRAEQRSLLRKDIFSYLDQNLAGSANGYFDLCMLHQRISQMFFTYFYDKKLDIVSLFSKEMTYEAFMQSYSSIDALKKAVDFLISTAAARKTEEPETSYVERAKTYIMENLDKLLTVKDVSEFISLNPEYFTRLFKKETGHNIKDYIIECKLTIAKDLLVNSTLPISMVALELGYSNFSHFTQMFRRAEGVTPKEYRALHKT